MKLIGLTGGIGSGKTTVASLLAARGAVVIDADAIGHEAYRPGQLAHQLIADRFGEDVVSPDGTIDRARLGQIVFSSEENRRDLEAIVHPLILHEIIRRIDEHRDTDDIVVVDAALLIELGVSLGFDALVVVAVSPEHQVERLVRDRGLDPAHAAARIKSQGTLEAKIAAADYVIDNRGSPEDLQASVETLWGELNA